MESEKYYWFFSTHFFLEQNQKYVTSVRNDNSMTLALILSAKYEMLTMSGSKIILRPWLFIEIIWWVISIK